MGVCGAKGLKGAIKMPTNKAEDKTSNGWLSPNGTFYSCDYCGHWRLAGSIIETEKIPLKSEEDQEDKLEREGWLKLSGGKWSYIPFGNFTKKRDYHLLKIKEISQKQIDYIMEWCMANKIKFPPDYLQSDIPEGT